LCYALFTAWYDIIIGDMFMDVPAEQFQADIAVETARTAAAFPDRYKRFVIDGGMHTTLIGDPSGVIGSDLGAVELPPGSLSLLSDLELGTMAGTRSRDGLGIDAWVAGFLADDDRWVDVVDEPGEAPVWESRSR
jgi:hypothetical protein